MIDNSILEVALEVKKCSYEEISPIGLVRAKCVQRSTKLFSSQRCQCILVYFLDLYPPKDFIEYQCKVSRKYIFTDDVLTIPKKYEHI